MVVQDLGSRHGDGSITPPATPTGASHIKTGSPSSDFLSSLSGLRRGDSAISLSGPQRHSASKPGSTEVIIFPNHSIDYEFRTDAKGRKKTIGEGAWSNVYLATPTLPTVTENVHMTGMSPPLTPVHSREPSSVSSNTLAIPRLYAIKVPAMTSARKVLGAEAKILSYLTRFPNAHEHIVPFFGLDPRTGSLILKAMDATLESWITNELNTVSEPLRAKKLAEIFPTIALSLIDSLEWMQEKDCIQADIKPSNILIDSTPSGVPKAVYTDFSSAILTKPGATIDSAASPLGAGTWDYLDPKLLSSSNPAPLSASTDLWSLAITLLYLVIGRSPYDAFKSNKYQQREMIKSGSPLQCLGYEDVGTVNMKRLSSLSKDLCFDVQKWFEMVLVKDPASRASLKEWRGALVAALAVGTAKV
ncbi:kinase-like protein [Plenodomus tracheiphilus IPT5]|uniref:non-specific serine/threonine protein kinase n=1 Tax=Plenodomus tracheiphilus IPT5 TaxID=1408161 RepID=A0A6A7B1T0_9PLEO|nr:kinase-like protein [Plenodomus tracheiphilus IPT5]